MGSANWVKGIDLKSLALTYPATKPASDSPSRDETALSRVARG